jgi:hypothetical protein
MALSIDAKHDLQRLEDALGLYPQELLAAAVRSQNRVMTTLRAQGAKELAPQFVGLKISALKRQLKITRATAREPAAVLEFSAKRFRLFGNFNTRQTSHGVSVSRLPWRLEAADGDELPRQVLAHAFIQRARGGRPNVWIRVGTKRYPIIGIFVSAPAAAFRDRDLGTNLTALGRFRFAIELKREAQFRLSMRPAIFPRAANDGR